MGEPLTNWTVDEQQCSFVRQVFDLTVHDTAVVLTLDTIDEGQSLSVGREPHRDGAGRGHR